MIYARSYFQINKPATLQKAISILDVFPTRGLDVDFDNDKQSITDIGDIYEYLLSKLSTAGKMDSSVHLVTSSI